jgi:hypothetical protein
MVAVTGGLTSINLSENLLGEEGTKVICEALEQNMTLKELDISGREPWSNIGGTAGVKHVAKMLGVNGGLTSINLSGNALCGLDWHTAEGITAIADALRVNGALTTLSKFAEISNHLAYQQRLNINIDPCRAVFATTGCPAGAGALAPAIAANGALTELSMFCTHVGDEGARAIREAIQGNKGTKLASLNMAGNNIGQVGAKSVAAMVTVMVTVTGALTQVLAF